MNLRYFSITFQEQSVREVESGTSAFYDDINSRLWFTYRKNFEEFKGTRINSDCGWGCMIRCGQMLLANALIQLVIYENFRQIKISLISRNFCVKLSAYLWKEKITPKATIVRKVATLRFEIIIQSGDRFWHIVIFSN